MIKNLLSINSWFIYNKLIAKAYGVDEAIILGCLCNKASYFKEDEFFCTQEYLIEDTCLTKYRIINALQNLKDNGAINIVKKGLPAKNYYSINEKAIQDVLLRTTSSIKIDTTGDSKIDTTGDNKIDTTYNNNKEVRTKEEEQSINIVVEKKQRQLEVCKNVIEYLNNTAGTNFQYKSKSSNENIIARLNEGFKEEDFIKVIKKKNDDWKGTEYYKFMKPSTLFSKAHFEDYLNQPEVKVKGNKKIVPISTSITNVVNIEDSEDEEMENMLGDIFDEL